MTLKQHGTSVLGASIAALAFALSLPTDSVFADGCTSKSCTYYVNGTPHSGSCASSGSNCDRCSNGLDQQQQDACKV
jgi:hypothetical protein